MMLCEKNGIILVHLINKCTVCIDTRQLIQSAQADVRKKVRQKGTVYL